MCHILEGGEVDHQYRRTWQTTTGANKIHVPDAHHALPDMHFPTPINKAHYVYNPHIQPLELLSLDSPSYKPLFLSFQVCDEALRPP